MTRFFRKFRLENAEKGRFRKYALYALGEILLIVIGILIALQINRWNENRNSDKAQHLLYENLLADFSNRLIELETLQKYRRMGSNATHEINTWITKGELPHNPKLLDSLLVTLDYTYIFNDEFRTLDMLFNTGIINEIENEALKKDLLNWPVILQETQERTTMLYENVEKLFDTMAEHLAYRRLYNQMDLGIPVLRFSRSQHPNQYNELLTNRRFENLLAERAILLNLAVLEHDELIESTKDIVELLNQELK